MTPDQAQSRLAEAQSNYQQACVAQTAADDLVAAAKRAMIDAEAGVRQDAWEAVPCGTRGQCRRCTSPRCSAATFSLEVLVDSTEPSGVTAGWLRELAHQLSVSPAALVVGAMGRVVDKTGELVASWTILDGNLVREG